MLPMPGVQDKSVQPVAFEMEILGAHPQSRPVGRSELPGKVNYFIGRKPELWRTNIPTYARVEYAAVYPDIDLVYYGSEGRLEHDFIVRPGARPDAIRLQYSGIKSVRLASNGDLLLDVRGHEIRQQAPAIYQQRKEGVRESVSGQYVLYAGNEVGFRVAAYDVRRPLIIDPALVYSTFLGGSQHDAANAIAINSDGTAYIVGSATSDDFPTTPGAFQESDPTPRPFYRSHAFVAKLNATGTALLYSTYLGGIQTTSTLDESATSIAVDAEGNAFVGGYTSADDNFPTTPNSLQPHAPGVCRDVPGSIFTGYCDGFLTKLNATGSALLYSTYLGGTDPDQITGLAIDSAGVVYVTGTTYSNNFPTTPGAVKNTFDHGGVSGFFVSNAFVTKIDPSRAGIAGLIYSTYLGGSYAKGKAIAVDSMGAAYVTGVAPNKDFPVTSGAFQSGGSIYVAKLNPAGSALIYGATLGGQNPSPHDRHAAFVEESNALVIDTAGNAYVAGTTNTTDFPVTPGAFQTTLPATDAAFVTKLDPSGTTLAYSTFLGGTGSYPLRLTGNAQIAKAITLDGAGNAYVTGITGSDFPTSSVTLDPMPHSAFITELNPTASGLIFSTFLGGSTVASQDLRNFFDQGRAIAVDAAGNIYVAGGTVSCDFPTTPGAFQESMTPCNPNVSARGFVSKISISAPGAAAALIPGRVSFGTLAVGSDAPQQSVVLTSRGNAELTISNMAFDLGTAFSQTSDCPAVPFTLSPAASCTVTFGFRPPSTGQFTGRLTLSDNGFGNPHFVDLIGFGGIPGTSLSRTSITFGSQVLNTTSAAQPVTLTATGSASLQLASITSSGDFAQTNDCGSRLELGSACTINVTFTPTALGDRQGSVTITDNAPTSPQTILLGGTGTDFALSASSSSSATMTAGQTANYTVNITPMAAFTQPISLVCTGAPAGATCTANPISVTPPSTAPVPVNVSVTTTARGVVAPFSLRLRWQPLVWMCTLLVMLVWCLVNAAGLRQKVVAATLIVLFFSFAGCGGGDSSGGTPPPGGGGTPAGTYNLTVTGTSGTATRSTNLSLTVR